MAHDFNNILTVISNGVALAAVLGIVRGHAGAIDLDSRPGQGTRVRVFFPASAAGSVIATPVSAEEIQGQGVVLLVDDEENVRITTRLLLQEFGFEKERRGPRSARPRLKRA